MFRDGVSKFKIGEIFLDNKACSGRLLTAVIDGNWQQIDGMIHADWWTTVYEIVVSLNYGHDTMQRIIEDLGYRKVCASSFNTFFER